MKEKLTEQEITKRMQEWRNLKKLHKNAVEKKNKYIEKYRKERERVFRLEQESMEQKKTIEELKLQVEELQRIVFGKRKKKDDEDDDNNDEFLKLKNKKKEKKPRKNSSYQREIPEEKDITGTEEHKINKCPDCGDELRRKKKVIFYIEDIPLPTEDEKLKTVEEHHVWKGYCNKCKKWHSRIKIPSSKVIIGLKVKIYIVYLNILMRLSFEQIQKILWDTYHFKISKGEVNNILQEIGQKFKPEFTRIKKKLREGRGIHLDETSWGQFWLWVAASMDSEDVLYLAGRSRGKGNAEEILDGFLGIIIVDGYPAYINVHNGKIQLCWAHPHRKIRELACSKSFSKQKKKHHIKAYEKFSEIYELLRKYTEEPFNTNNRAKQKKELQKMLRKFSKPHKLDSKKLANIKIQFKKRESDWLTCMDYEGVPCDNNKGERKLRTFAIKRKISFGNKSKEGAEAFEVNASVLMTFWNKFKESFFQELIQLAA